MKRSKKSRSSKPKKVGRRRHDTNFDDSMSSKSVSSASNDSYSLYSDSDSTSSVSFSSSNSEGTYRVKKKVKVSRLRNKLKHRRKRVRRKPSSTEDSSRTKKRKRSRKKADSKSLKKSRKDKSRRNVRHSSAPSGSHDLSTCKEESVYLSEECELQKLTYISRKSMRGKRKSPKERVETRSSSSSPYNWSRDQSYSGSQGDKTFDGGHESRRLRSVIVFPEQAHEKQGNSSEKDLPREEIVHDRDDYPSLRSNGSSSGGSKRSCSPVALGDKIQEKNVQGQETCVSNSREVEIIESRKNDCNAGVNDPFLNEFEMHKQEIGSGDLGADDLEVVLRRTALENLKKFRGGIRKMNAATNSQVNSIDGDAKESFSSKTEIFHGGVSPKQDDTNMIDYVEISERSSRTASSTQGISNPYKDIAEKGNMIRGSGTVTEMATHSSDGLAVSVSSLREDLITTQAAVVESESQDSVLRGKDLSINSSLNQEMTLQSSPNKKLNEDRQSEKKNLLKTTHAVASGMTNDSETGVNNASSEQFTSQGQGLNKEQIESNGGIEFEQKTMSVMRGGEMVQVSLLYL